VPSRPAGSLPIRSWRGPSVSSAIHLSAGAATALLDAYRDQSGHLPALDATSFSASVSGWLNYVYGQICGALDAKGDEDHRYMERHVRHILVHAPTRAFLEQVLDVVPLPM
jgi:hypothetical protein